MNLGGCILVQPNAVGQLAAERAQAAAAACPQSDVTDYADEASRMATLAQATDAIIERVEATRAEVEREIRNANAERDTNMARVAELEAERRVLDDQKSAANQRRRERDGYSMYSEEGAEEIRLQAAMDEKSALIARHREQAYGLTMGVLDCRYTRVSGGGDNVWVDLPGRAGESEINVGPGATADLSIGSHRYLIDASGTITTTYATYYADAEGVGAEDRAILAAQKLRLVDAFLAQQQSIRADQADSANQAAARAEQEAAARCDYVSEFADDAVPAPPPATTGQYDQDIYNAQSQGLPGAPPPPPPSGGTCDEGSAIYGTCNGYMSICAICTGGCPPECEPCRAAGCF